MVQKTSPFIESKYGWNLGESGWNTGADENFLKFAFMLDNGVDGVVTSLPQTAVNGTSYYLTTDNRFYFVVDGTYYSSPCPKWFTFKLKSSGQKRIYDGSSVITLPSDIDVSATLNALQTTDQSLVKSSNLSNKVSAQLGASLVGYYRDASGFVGRDLANKISEVTSLADFGSASSSIDNTAAIQLAINYLQSRGGGILNIPAGDWRFKSITTNGTVSFRGVGLSSKLVHVPSDNTSDGIIFDCTGSFLRPSLSNFTYLCEGEGRYGIVTSVDGTQFTRAFAIDIDGLSIRRSNGASLGWASAIRYGDMVAGSFKRSEIRGGFDVSIDASGQKDTVGITLEAATANIAVDMNGLQIVGVKYPIRIGENVEGYFVDNCELVNGLDGVSSYNTVGKPGGFHSNLHVNCSRYPINFQNRRDFTISGIQLYRGSGHVNNAVQNWVGFNLNNCIRYTISGQQFRVITGYSSKSYGYILNGNSDFTISDGEIGEDGAATDGFLLNNCKAFNIGPHKFSTGMSTWYTLTSCLMGNIGPGISQDSTVPVNAYNIDATNAKRNIKVDRTNCDRLGYEEVTYSAADSKTIVFKDGMPVRTINFSAGAAAYTFDLILQRANHLAGNTYRFRLVMPASTNPTVRILDDSSANIRRTITGTATATIYDVEMVFNNSGWVIRSFNTLAA